MQDGEKYASEREVQEEDRDGRKGERERVGQIEEREIEWVKQIEKSGKKGGREKKKELKERERESDLN